MKKEKPINKIRTRDPLLETSGEMVGFYEREFYVFSNFSSFAVEWRGRLWQTAEHAFQAAHFMENNLEIVEEIYKAHSADDSKRIAHKNKYPEDWDSQKIAIMEEICRCKVEQNPYVKKKLLQTGTVEIIEDSPKDDFWGWGPDKNGRNELGKIWMRLREQMMKGK